MREYFTTLLNYFKELQKNGEIDIEKEIEIVLPKDSSDFEIRYEDWPKDYNFKIPLITFPKYDNFWRDCIDGNIFFFKYYNFRKTFVKELLRYDQDTCYRVFYKLLKSEILDSCNFLREIIVKNHRRKETWERLGIVVFLDNKVGYQNIIKVDDTEISAKLTPHHQYGIIYHPVSIYEFLKGKDMELSAYSLKQYSHLIYAC